MGALKINEKPDIHRYHDYLSFLRDHLDFLKNSEFKKSLRAIAQDANISASLLAMILSGKRRMTERVFSKLISVLDFSKAERQVLKLLRTIAESDVAIERLEALEDLQKNPQYMKQNKNSVMVFQYLSNWINVAIREMISLPNFTENPDWIKERLRGNPSNKEIMASLEFLKTNGYAGYNSDGKLELLNQHLDCSEGVFKISLGEFHKQMLNLAGNSIEEIERDLRHILGHTFTTEIHQIAKVKEILSGAVKSIENLSAQNETGKTRTHVYHVEIALFPLTHDDQKEDDIYE